MNCTRCGKPSTAKRDDGLCGPCAINRDWQELIVLLQDARVETAVAGRGERRTA